MPELKQPWHFLACALGLAILALVIGHTVQDMPACAFDDSCGQAVIGAPK